MIQWLEIPAARANLAMLAGNFNFRAMVYG
jgi:hypothetical protein